MHTTRPRSRARSAVALIGWLGATLAAAAIAAAAGLQARELYDSLTKPAWVPPDRALGPVWLVIHLLMAVAVWLVWRERPPATDRIRTARRKFALRLYAVQLALDALWLWSFVALRSGASALGELVALWVLVVLLVPLFASVRRLAGWLLVPQLIWVAFAAALTWILWQANVAIL